VTLRRFVEAIADVFHQGRSLLANRNARLVIDQRTLPTVLSGQYVRLVLSRR
jgi:hypothetical protein